MIALVGYTGFVGGNIAAGHAIDGLYNSKNIEEAFGTHPDLLIFSGLRAEKFLAEKFPEEDLKSIQTAQEQIQKIGAKKTVLISTVDVYENAAGVTEESPANGQGAYGKNRALLEEWVREHCEEHLIVRLPGLFGKGIRKNFIYDYIHFLPALLKEEKFAELSEQETLLKAHYVLNEKGFYQLQKVTGQERAALCAAFEKLGFSALNFTDSRGIFQYYNLEHLYEDIQNALEAGIKTLNITTEPVSIREIYQYLTGKDFINEIAACPPHYDARTEWFNALGGFAAADGQGGYLYHKQQVLEEIKVFAEKEKTL